MGWQAASADGILPSVAGFGCREAAQPLATKVRAWIAASGQPYHTPTEVEAQFPQLRFLTPQDRRLFIEALKRSGCELLYHDDKSIAQYGLSSPSGGSP